MSQGASRTMRKLGGASFAPSASRVLQRKCACGKHVTTGGMIESGENVEQAVRKFLEANPNIVRNIEIVVAAIIAGAVISDIVSAGGAIAKDPAVVAILGAMLRIAQAIRAAAP